MNYYNEFDPKAAAWLQQLIDNKQIPYGYVDPRSILEVQASDLSGFTQCHFFAGIGGWSLALQLADWPEDRPVWTASLPCQPFSTAGKQLGTSDERHLSPTFLELVRQCNPPVIIGEQVASKLARTDWLPGIRLELQTLGYSFGAADLCAPCAGEIGEGRIVRGDQESWERVIIGAPHIRQRLYWVADRGVAHTTELRRGEGTADGARDSERDSTEGAIRRPTLNGSDGGLADTDGEQRVERLQSFQGKLPERTGCSSEPERVGNTDGSRPKEHGRLGKLHLEQRQGADTHRLSIHAGVLSHAFVPCRDGKTRRTESGIFPLVNGIPRGLVPSGDPSDPSYANDTAEGRAMRLKGYGNAIVPPLAASFIRAFTQISQEHSA